MGINYTKPSGDAGATPPGGGPVSLTKGSPTVSLSKGQGTSGTMRVNLNWNARPAGAGGGGFLKRMSGGGSIDLDLGALYELQDGSKGCVQALGNAFRDRTSGPALIWLDGDDRSGTNQAGENLYVDLSRLAEIKRVLVYAFIYEGVPNWAAADASVTLFPVGAPQMHVRLDEPGSTSMCGIAMLENNGGQLTVHRLVHHFTGHRLMDEHYGWGMQWQRGSK